MYCTRAPQFDPCLGGEPWALIVISRSGSTTCFFAHACKAQSFLTTTTTTKSPRFSQKRTQNPRAAMSPRVFFPSLRALMAPIIQSGLPLPSSPAVLTGGARAPTVPSCTASVFSALSVVADHVQIHALDATAHTGLAVDPDLGLPPTTRQQIASADVCLLTINYTHPDEETAPVVTTWVGLPLAPSSWNGRFLMNGGGGWLAGDQARVVSAVASGYASASTNAGHNGTTGDEMPTWGLTSDGAVNGPVLEDFASRAIVEAVRFGKAATDLYFGAKPKFSYWNGCSTGGRQGHGNHCSSIPSFSFSFFLFLADAANQLSLRRYRASSVGS